METSTNPEWFGTNHDLSRRLANQFPTDFYPLRISLHPQSKGWYHWLLITVVPTVILGVAIGFGVYFQGQTTSTTVLGLYDPAARSSTELIRPSFFYANDTSPINIFTGIAAPRFQISYSPVSFLNASHCYSQPFRFASAGSRNDLSSVVSFISRFLPSSLSIAAYHYPNNSAKMTEFTLSQSTTSLINVQLFITIDRPKWDAVNEACGFDWVAWCAFLNDTLPDPDLENKMSNASLWVATSQFGPVTMSVICSGPHVFFPGDKLLQDLSDKFLPSPSPKSGHDDILLCLTRVAMSAFGGDDTNPPVVNYTDICADHFVEQNQQQPRFLNQYVSSPTAPQVIAQVLPVVGLVYGILRVLLSRAYRFAIPRPNFERADSATIPADNERVFASPSFSGSNPHQGGYLHFSGTNGAEPLLPATQEIGTS